MTGVAQEIAAADLAQAAVDRDAAASALASAIDPSVRRMEGERLALAMARQDDARARLA